MEQLSITKHLSSSSCKLAEDVKNCCRKSMLQFCFNTTGYLLENFLTAEKIQELPLELCCTSVRLTKQGKWKAHTEVPTGRSSCPDNLRLYCRINEYICDFSKTSIKYLMLEILDKVSSKLYKDEGEKKSCLNKNFQFTLLQILITLHNSKNTPYVAIMMHVPFYYIPSRVQALL